MNKKVLVVFAVLSILAMVILPACGPTQQNIEQGQQAAGVASISENQPIPDLGGWSSERQLVIDTYRARNSTVATYSYWFTMNGQIIEICPSIGYPIPYSTQLSNPQIALNNSYGSVIANPEPNGLYPPDNAAATLISCVNDDGSISVIYFEEYVETFPFRITSDRQLERLGEPSFTVDLNR
jgi:hypothetical protein